jgi:DNA-binding response OmpR family regulator
MFMATDLPGILIVDDNEDNRYTLQLMLESDGHERITCAAGGNEAIALIKKEKFSLVLLDLMMPDLNGNEVLRATKSDPDQRDIPVVMISADTDADKVSQCIELGADDYLPKPFNPTILRARIGAALRRHSLRALESEYLGKLENEKRHCENLLRNILPAEIATRLRNGESNIADHFDDATVIFADVVGFGKITARMKAYEIVACLNQLFSEFDRLAEDAGIERSRRSVITTWRSPACRRHAPITCGWRRNSPSTRLQPLDDCGRGCRPRFRSGWACIPALSWQGSSARAGSPTTSGAIPSTSPRASRRPVSPIACSRPRRR